jgi:SAM-dependent methyltransferase
VDLGESTVEHARAATGRAGLSEAVRFHLGDAERLPLPDTVFDAVVCECAFCVFPDKAAAAAELARVLRPGGRVGITDVTTAETLPAELTTLAAWVACIADARPARQYGELLGSAGLRVTHTERHDIALTTMIDQIEARVTALRMLQPDRLRAAGVEADAVLGYVEVARRAATGGLLGYVLMVAEKPA